MVDEALDDLNLGDLIATLGSIDDDEIDWQNVARTTVLIHQTFRYEYPGSITSLRQRLMVVPPDYHDDQRLVTHKLRVTGSNVDTERSYDTFGNVVLDLTLAQVEREVEFTSWIVVEREAGANGAHYSEPLAPDVRFSEPSRLTRPDSALTAVASELEATGATGLELAELVSARVHDHLRYDWEATSVATTAAEAWAGGAGVCQDYTHCMLALARLQRRFRLLESPYRTPQSLVGGDRLDAALMASSGRTAATKAMGKASTQHQHLVQTEVPTSLLETWLAAWRDHWDHGGALRVELRPHVAGSDLLDIRVLDEDGASMADVVFTSIVDRRGRTILSVRDQNTNAAVRRRRLMTLVQLFLVHRYRASSIHYLTPTDDNAAQTERMRQLGLFSTVQTEIGQIIVGQVDRARVAELVAPNSPALGDLIRTATGVRPAAPVRAGG